MPVEAAPVAPVATPDAAPRRRGPWVGVLALTLAVVMVLVWALALSLASAAAPEPATWLAIAADVLSVVAVALGIVAVIVARGRAAGVVAIVVGILLNPVVLLHGLTWIGAL